LACCFTIPHQESAEKVYFFTSKIIFQTLFFWGGEVNVELLHLLSPLLDFSTEPKGPFPQHPVKLEHDQFSSGTSAIFQVLPGAIPDIARSIFGLQNDQVRTVGG
jgi:hypothetical protein